MSIIEAFLSGNLDDSTFLKMLENNIDLQEQINALIPVDAVNDPTNSFWDSVGYDSYLPDDFNCVNHIKRVCYDGSAWVALNVFGTLENLYTASHSNFIATKKYVELYRFYLSVVGECYEGPQTEWIVKDLLSNVVGVQPKTKRNKEAKALIQDMFHVVDNHKPRWIQGAEWPMGTKSPMQFIESRRIKEGIDEGWEYVFCDYETGEEKRIVQYY